MKTVSCLLGLLCLLPACRTTDGSGLKDQTEGGFSCTMTSPSTRGEKFEVRAASVGGGRLVDARTIYTSDAGGRAVETSLGTVASVDAGELTGHGERNLRGYFKNIVDIDFKSYDCFPVSGVKSLSYFCLGKAGGGERPAFWATNASHQRFAYDLTIYQTKCGQ